MFRTFLFVVATLFSLSALGQETGRWIQYGNGGYFDNSYERYMASRGNQSTQLTVGVTSFQLNTPTIVDRRILIERNDGRTVVPCTSEEAADLAVKQVTTATIVGAVLGWVLTDRRAGVNTGARYGVGTGILSTINTHCVKVVSYQQHAQEVRTVERKTEVVVTERTHLTRREAYCKEDDMTVEGTACVLRSGGTLIRILPLSYRNVSVPAARSNEPTKDAQGHTCFLSTPDGYLLYDFFSRGSNNPEGRMPTSGSDCNNLKVKYGMQP